MWILWILISVCTLYLLIYLWIIHRNKKHNIPLDMDPEQTTQNRILNDQNRKTGQAFRYGFHKASWNGCEAIAIHNAKVLLGIPSTLSQVMTAIQAAGGMLCYGLFGSNPFVIGRVMKRCGVHAQRIPQKEMNTPGLYILSFWNEGAPWNGAHTVTLHSDGRSWTIYNYHCNGKSTTTSPLTFDRRFICAYRLEEPQ